MKTLVKLLLCLPLLYVPGALAQWDLDNEASTLSFVTIKADHVAEVHTFDRLTGGIDASGEVQIEIALASVNTLIDIRNERMQNLLFESGMFPSATLTGTVDIADLRALQPGESRVLALEFSLDLHGVEQDYLAEVLATRTEDGVRATSLKPVIVNADTHNLTSGVEALREVAGLPSISRAVPVSFSVLFN